MHPCVIVEEQQVSAVRRGKGNKVGHPSEPVQAEGGAGQAKDVQRLHATILGISTGRSCGPHTECAITTQRDGALASCSSHGHKGWLAAARTLGVAANEEAGSHVAIHGAVYQHGGTNSNISGAINKHTHRREV